jgi:tyrosine-protein phosphatase SIW14
MRLNLFRISDFGFRIFLTKPVPPFRLRFLFLILALLAQPGCSASERGVPAQYAILNFGKINDSLYRGAQPDAAGITNLQRLGIKTIIDLRMPAEVTKDEATLARANGITWTNVPLRGVGRPTDEQVKKVLALIEAGPSPVFVHCVHGADRTGTIIACYRIQQDKWTSDTALRDAKLHGISWLELGMKHYVASFAKTLAQPEQKLADNPPRAAIGVH